MLKISLLSVCVCLCRSAGGVHIVLLCDADQAHMAVLSAPAPSRGQAVPGPFGDHRFCKSFCHDFHRPGSHLLLGLQSAGAI